MVFLSMGLVVAAVVGAFVLGGALDRGFPIEVAILRGAVAFVGVAFAGYLGELTVVTAPRRAPRATLALPASAEEQPPPARLAAPRSADENVNEDDADAELQTAA